MAIERGFTRENEQHLGLSLFELLDLVAQLREMVLSDGSAVPHGEHEHDRLFATKVPQAPGLAWGIDEREIGCRLPFAGAAHPLQIVIDQSLTNGFRVGLIVSCQGIRHEELNTAM